MKNPNSMYSSPHFNLEELAAGVFAAIHESGGDAIANAGIIDLGDTTIIFDTFISHIAAKDLHSAAEKLTGSSVGLVINSHYHNDHIRGNQVFSEAAVLSTSATLELIKTEGAKELEWDQGAGDRYEKYLVQQKEIGAHTSDPNLEFIIEYHRVLRDSMDGMEVRLPNKTFESSLAIEGSLRNAELICYGGGHTSSDAFLYLPNEKIAFLADLLFVKCHPFLADGNPQDLMEYIDKLMKLNIDIAVPGHGPVGTSIDLELMQKYIHTSTEIISEYISDGLNPEKLNAIPIPSQFLEWEYPMFFYSNLNFLHNKIVAEE